MPTTVRVEDDVKRELDRLQGELLADRGERLSHSELLARLLRIARAHERELFEGAPTGRPTRANIDRLLARAPAVNVRARARDVDDALYGSRP